MLADSYKGAQILEYLKKDGKSYARIKRKCDRCGGHGIYAVGVHNGCLVPSPYDGGMCYECLGAGVIIEEVRDYTEAEYRAMQRAKEKREAKALERMNERRQENNRRTLINHGFAGEYAYAVIGDTYSIKDDLKAHGAKFSYEMLWVCPEEPTWLPTDRYVRICATDVFDFVDDMILVKDTARDFIDSLQPKSGKHLGSVGSRITVAVTVTKVLTFTAEYMKGWPTTSYKYIMRTPEGDVVTWTTQSVYWNEGYECTLVGTVKEHTEYNSVRQTVLTRCKEVK